MRAPSLMRRITIRLSLIALAAALVAHGLLYWRYVSEVGSLRDRSLQGQVEDIAAHLRPGADGRPELLLPDSIIEDYADAEGRFRFSVRTTDGAVIAGSAAATLPNPRADGERPGRTAFYRHDDRGRVLYGATQVVTVGGVPVRVQVEQDEEHEDVLVDSILEELFTDGGWAVLPFLAVMLLASLLTVRETLAPLKKLSSMAADIGPAATDVRLPTAGVPREILPLVDAVNSALNRLDRGFRLQREFTADAAHQLRTPLAVLRTHVDTLADDEAATALRRDLEAMARLVDQLLKVAQLEALSIRPDDRVSLNDVAREVCELLAPMAVAAGKTIALEDDSQGVTVRGSRDVLYNVIRNLAENALHHTPRGTGVVVQVTADPALHVIDAGPGVPPEMRGQIFQRFWRGDRRYGKGAGLGLAIVARGMELHGGSVTVEDAPDGGAVFSLRFPAPRPRPS